MESNTSKTEDTPRPALPVNKKPRRSRQSEPVPRFFLAKDGSNPGKPELGDEANDENDAMIKAFRSKGGVFYMVNAYRADAEVQGGKPTFVKRPLEK
jgi:hypothetical protein